VTDEIFNCPFCSAANPQGAEVCSNCGKRIADTEWMEDVSDEGATELGVPADVTIDAPAESFEPPPADVTIDAPAESIQEGGLVDVTVDAPNGFDEAVPFAVSSAAQSVLQEGATLAGRYLIESHLGIGGMGSVHRAKDIELDRTVALKVIRPEMAENPDVLQRFKHEIILSREITHRNVVRIFDLGQSDDIRFISMEYVEGKDLSHIIKERGALPAEEAVDIIEQTCLALDAAHQQGVVHRDLKPQNIMLDPEGRVVVMDFGIARSIETSGMTQTGSLLGTPDYMSPEQVKGETVDARSDLFALGIIFYQLLTGELPYVGETPMAAMFTRTQKKAAPVRDLNPDLPGFLGDVVGRCLEISPHKRYQSAREILQDLTIWRGGSTHMTIGPTMMHGLRPSTTVARKRVRYALMAAAALALVGVIAIGVKLVGSRAPADGDGTAAVAVPAEVVSLAILPFQNASGDPEVDWLGSGLAEMLRTDVGQTASLRTVSSDRLHQVLRDLRITSEAALEEATLRRVADFANADTVVWGQFLKLGEQIRIDATVRNFERHETTTLKAEAANEQQLLRAVQELAQGVRDNLALSRSAVRELEEQAFIPSASSMVALRHYNEGLEHTRQGNNLEAVTSFETSVEGDPNFALAHSRLALAYLALGRGQKAEETSRQAVELSADLPDQERYLILAGNARVENDFEAGIDAYQNLLRTRPADAELNLELGELYEQGGDLDLAQQHVQTAIESDPQNITAQLAMGRILIKSGSPQESLAPLNQALSLAIQVENQEARANTQQALGIAYRYMGRSDEALRSFEESLATKREIGDQRGMSASLSMIGQILVGSGDLETARTRFEESAEISREIGDDQGLASSLGDLGEIERIDGNYDLALEHTREALRIQMEIGAVWNQARSLNNIGAIFDSKGEYAESLIYYQRALEIREQLGDPGGIADSLHNLAETYTLLGRYEQAVDHSMRALAIRRDAADEWGAAIESFSLGRVYQHQARYGAGLASMQEALDTLRRLEETGPWYIEVLAGYGNALSLMGSFTEAEPVLEEAAGLAQELENARLIATTLDYQGDRLFYTGDFAGAKSLYEQARRAAEEEGDPYLILGTRADLARAELMAGQTQRAIPMIDATLREASSRGVGFLETRCTVCMGSALLTTGDLSGAEQRLRKAIGDAEDMGARDLLAQSHHLLAETLRASGNEADAARAATKAAEYLEEIRTEAGSDALLARADLAPVAAAAGSTPQ
jgi:tetratricopeptide (TPR) repeat protein